MSKNNWALRLNKVRRAYDLTVEQYRQGIDPMDLIPEVFKQSVEYKIFKTELSRNRCSSGAPSIQEFLAPESGMRFLDCGCCANLANYRLDKWPSIYYGIDISPKLIGAMQGFAVNEGIEIGGLWEADLTDMPFGDSSFDIAAAIGVLEYGDIDYARSALVELYRVLKPGGRVVLDIPNPEHPSVETMFKLEQYLGRLNYLIPVKQFEAALEGAFEVVNIDSSGIMRLYFLRCNKHYMQFITSAQSQ